ncbi:MAG TPA: hypothetical protein VM076_24910 [Gemmatimonadaceae bacterium]|nr:hypothetical protein [Gemmatimonadaceae bacterium]
MRRWLMRRRVVLPLALVLVSVPAYPCGGPGADIIDRPLVPVETFLNRIYCEDEFEHVTREQFRMLDPLRRQMADSVADVYGWAYVAGANSYSPYEAPDSVITRHDRELLGPVRAAIARGVYPEAAAAARSAVEAVLDQPAGLAVGYSEVLRTAVEFLDVAPRLTAADRDAAARYFAAGPASRTALGTSGLLPVVLRDALEVRALSRESAAAYADVHPRSPRAASLRFVGLQEAMRTGIPNGYAFNIKDSVPPARWAALESLHDDWLRRYASHPMADYVRLSRGRLNFFKGDGAAAWNALLGMYPRHRQRVLAEMRYLTQHQIHPPTLDDPRIDWPLRTALVAFDAVSEAQWNKYWRAADANATQPWAAAMQERLLYHAVVMAEPLKRLPSEFPKSTRAPTPLWASLRLVALLQV